MTLYAAPAVVSGALITPGTNIVLVGTGNTVYGAPGARVTAFEGGNNIVGTFDQATATAVSASLATASEQAQNYPSLSAAEQEAFLNSPNTNPGDLVRGGQPRRPGEPGLVHREDQPGRHGVLPNPRNPRGQDTFE